MMNTSFTRRSWLSSAVAALGLPRAGNAAEHPFKHAIGVQLYTVRRVIDKAPEETLKRIAEIGYTEVETGRDTIDRLAPLLEKYKLQLVSTHVEIPVITGEWGSNQKPITMEEAIESLKRHKVGYMVFPYVLPRNRGTTEAYRKLADQLNVARAK